MVARGAGAAGPVLLACRQWDPLGLARRLPSPGVGAWRCAPLLPWRVQCPVCVCAALAAGSGGSGWYLVLCLSRFPLPAPRVPRCVWRAELSWYPLPSLAGTPFHAVCAFRASGPVALLVVPACPLRVCALALPRRPLPPLLGGMACAPRAVPALGAGRSVQRRPCPSACPAPVPCPVQCAWGGGAVRSWFPPTWLGVAGVAVGRLQGGCLLLSRGASGVRRSPFPNCPSTGRAVGVRYPRVVGAGVRVWGPFSVPSACTPFGGCAPRDGSVAFVCRGAALGGGGCAPYPPFVRPGGACRAGGRSASFRPSAFPGQATKRESLAPCCPWGAWPPIQLRVVLARILWARSVRRPGALARACLFSAAPVGAGGWGGGAGRASAPPSGGGGDHPPCLGGWGPGPPRLAGRWGGWGGGSCCGLHAPLLGGGTQSWPPSCRPGPPRAEDRSPGASCRPEPPPLPSLSGLWSREGHVGRGLHTVLMRRRAPPPSLVRALLQHAGVGAGGWGRWAARCAGPAASPPPRVAVSSGGGGVPLAPGGLRAAPVAPKLGGERGGDGGDAPPPHRPVGRCLRRAPPWYTRAVGVAGRPRASGAVRSAADGSVRRGGGGGTPPPWCAPPSSPGQPLIGPLRLRRPGRRRSAVGGQRAGRAGACLGRGAPAPRVQWPLLGGCGAAVSSVCLRPLLGLSGRGGGVWGALWSPGAASGRPGGGRHGGLGPGGQPSAGGSHPSPAPLYLEPDPRAGLRWGPSSPLPSSRGAGRPGAAMRVSGQQLAGCGAAGSPPRSLSPPPLPREVARAPSSRPTVGGARVGGPSSPPNFLASAVWAVTCAAACVGAGAVAAAGCAGGSASGRGRCARPGGASCWRPHP